MNIKQTFDNLIIDAVNNNVNDLHFILNRNEVVLKYRLNKLLLTKTTLNYELYNRLLRYVKFKCNLDPSVTNRALDGAFTTIINEQPIYIRLSTVPLLNGNSLVLRIIYSNNSTLETINSVNEQEINRLFTHLCNNTGIYIFTGPTGSGKTTTMYYLLNKYVEKYKKKVITIENPIEIVNDKFTQIQVDENNNLNYNVGLKVALRQDPDIIMIGEIRDEETARNVFRAGLTGHSVITTMHTKNKLGVIKRFIDFGFHKSEIESVISGICNQRLINHQTKIKSIYDVCLSSEIEQMIKDMKEEKTIYDQIQKYSNPKTK